METNCLFCRIVLGEIPTPFVAENEHAVAFRDIDPKAPLHVLVIPRRHVESLATADDERLLGTLMSLAAQIARDEGVAERGYRAVINTGADGGQSVGHLHVHVMGGRQMKWPPG